MEKPRNLAELVARVEEFWTPERRAKGTWRVVKSPFTWTGECCIQGAILYCLGLPLSDMTVSLHLTGEMRRELLGDLLLPASRPGTPITRWSHLAVINDHVGPDAALDELKSYAT